MNEMAGTILYVLHNSHDLSALYYDCTTFIIDVRHFQFSVKNVIQKKTQILFTEFSGVQRQHQVFARWISQPYLANNNGENGR